RRSSWPARTHGGRRAVGWPCCARLSDPKWTVTQRSVHASGPSAWVCSTPRARPASGPSRWCSARTTARSVRRCSWAMCHPARWHYHLYDEIVWIWQGEGRFHTREGTEPLGPGSAFRIRPREIHVVENTSPTDELVVVGLFTPAGSPSAAYLAEDTNVPYAIE